MDVQPTPTPHPPLAGIHWYTLVIKFTMYRTLQNVLKKEQQTPHGRATPPPPLRRGSTGAHWLLSLLNIHV